jgi:group I intron endonuclease
VTGDFYIGQTITSVGDRVSRHIYEAKNRNKNNKFHNAINKYGKENFIYGIVCECESREELDRKEDEYIVKWSPKYNTQRGGVFSYSKSEEEKEYMRQVKLEEWRTMSDEERERRSQSLKESHSTEEYKSLYIWKKFKEERGNKVYITDVETGETVVYESQRECERQGWSRSTIVSKRNTGVPTRRKDNKRLYLIRTDCGTISERYKRYKSKRKTEQTYWTS